MNNIIIREPRATDLNFITSSFLKSFRRESSLGRNTHLESFYKDFPKVIDSILSKSSVLVAALPENDNAIISFIVYEPTIIHYAYTKTVFRKMNVIKELIQKAMNLKEPLFYTFLTNDIKKIQIKYPELKFNPFINYQKEIHND